MAGGRASPLELPGEIASFGIEMSGNKKTLPDLPG